MVVGSVQQGVTLVRIAGARDLTGETFGEFFEDEINSRYNA